MKIGDLIQMKDGRIGIVTEMLNRGHDHRGHLLLCCIHFPSHGRRLWAWSYDLEALNESR